MVETHRAVTSRAVWALWCILFAFVLVAGGAAYYRAGVIALFVVLCFVLAASVTAYGYRQRQARLFRGLYRAERERREAQEEFRTTLYSIGDAVITTDANGAIKQMNPVAERLTGWKEAEARGRPLEEVFHIINEETRVPAENPIQRVLREGPLVGLANHTVLVARDGVERPIADSGAPIRDETGTIIGVVLVFRDQTEERAGYMALRTSLARQQALLAAVPEIIVEVDRNKVYVWANPAGYEFFGQDVIGKEAAHYFEGEQDTYAAVQPLFDGDENAVCLESWQRRKDGQKRLLAWWCRVLKDDQGNVTGALSSARDITERKAHEREIERLTRLYATLSQINEHLVRVRSREELFQEVCRITAEFAGFKVVWIGWRDRETHAVVPVGRGGDSEDYVNTIEVFADERPAGRGPVGTCIRENKTCIVQDFANDSSTAPWHAAARAHGLRAGAAFPIHLNGEVCGAFTVYTGEANVFRDKEVALLEEIAVDISFALEHLEQEEERRKLESQLRQAQKMEAIGRLAGGVAHDFNNMLNVILGYTEMALTKVEPRGSLRRDLEEIQGAARRSADLTRQLLAFSRRQTIAPQVLDLNAQLKGMERLLQRIIGEDIDLEFMLSPDLWPVHVDPSQVDQVVANLAINSRDAMPDGGRLTVETGNVALDEAHGETHVGFVPGDFVLLAISDSGCGMDRETLEHVFEPFFTTKGEGKGTGLGLATVYGIVKQNNGFVNVYSEPGQGTTVKIYLPRHVGDERAAPSEIPSAAPLGGPCVPAGGRETVLLVEDQEQVRVLAKLMLERLGYTVLEAATPADAVAQSETFQGEVHLLLTDVVMPDMNGKELADRIRAIRPGIRTLFVSGYTAAAIAHRGLLDAGIHFLQKPFSLDILARKTREALDS